MRWVGRILDSYVNPRLSRMLPTPLMFLSGYVNTENAFHCLNSTFSLSPVTSKTRESAIIRYIKANPIDELYDSPIGSTLIHSGIVHESTPIELKVA